MQSLRAKPRSEPLEIAAERDLPPSPSLRHASGARTIAPTTSAANRTSPSTGAAFATGFFTNALNPKATLFFISLFVTIVSPHTPKLLQAGYGLWMAIATAAWFSLVAVVFTRAEVRGKFLRHGHWIDRALGVVFIGFAAWLALATLE